MIFVLEGADCAGKSVAGAKLARALNCPYIAFGAPDKDGKREGFATEAEFLLHSVREHIPGPLEAGKQDLVVDRFAHSEVVYGMLYRGKTSFDPLSFARFMRIMRPHTKFILCQPPLRWSLAKWTERSRAGGEMLTPDQQGIFVDIYHAFNAFDWDLVVNPVDDYQFLEQWVLHEQRRV